MSFLRFVLALVAVAAAFVPGQTLAQTELLANGGLDSFDGNGLANGWGRWWEEVPKPTDGSYNYAYKPNWGPETNPALVQSGSGSQHIGTSWNPWHAGVQQTVSAPPGARLRLTAYGRAFASTPDFPNPSDGLVQVRMQIGADPTGGADWWSGNVQWSGMANPHDTWQPFSLEVVVGASGKVTIYLSANYKGDSRYHLDTWWDSASVVVIDAGTPPPPTTAPNTNPTQSSASIPTQPAAVVPSTDLPTPDPAGAIVYIVQPGDTLWSISLQAGLTVDQLKALNGLTGDSIIIGQQLIVGTAPPPTAATSETATSIPTQVAALGAGSVCITLFQDMSGNGAPDTGESGIADGQIRMTDSGGLQVTTYITDGTSDPHCVSGLLVGTYQVSVKLPPGYNPTTGNAFTVSVTPGGQATVAFGAQSSALAQPAETATPTTDDTGSNNSLAWIAVIGLVLAAGLIGAGGFWMWRRR